jgi:putative ABC transport system permease protein
MFAVGLLALPRAFREAHGAAILETFESRLDATRGARRRGALVVAEVVALLHEGAALRLGRARPVRRRPVAPNASPGSRVLRRRHGQQEKTMLSFWYDLRSSLRGLRKRPGFTFVVLATLALGIGANTAIFTVLYAVLLRPLPFPQPEELVQLWPAAPARSEPRSAFSIPDFEDWASRTQTLENAGLYSTTPGDVVLREGGPDGGGAEEIDTGWVSSGFFPTLGVSPALGRVPTVEDERNAPFVIVLSDRFWRARLGADPNVIGRTLDLDDHPYEVVGVMPPEFSFPDPEVQLWALFAVIPEQEIPLRLRPVRLLAAVGRLADGASVEQAEAELTGIAKALADEYPDTNEGLEAAVVVPLREAMVGDVRSTLVVLLAAVGFILLIACANMANLMLVRGAGRVRELAVRNALGSGRGRLARLVLGESLVLALAGGALGLVFASWGTRWLVSRAAAFLPRAEEVQPDASVLLFTLAVSVLTGLLFGVTPALRTGRVDAISALRSSAAAVTGAAAPRRRFGRGFLVMAEVALATVLLVGAGLMARSLDRLYSVDPGFDSEGVLAVTMIIASTRYEERDEYLGFYRRAMESFSALPGVEGVGSIRVLPLRGLGEHHPWRVPGAPEVPANLRPAAWVSQVSPGVFRVLGVPLLAGRDLEAADAGEMGAIARGEREFPIVINETLARTAFETEPSEAVGRVLQVANLPSRVVGVVGDVRGAALGEAAPPAVYVPQELLSRRVMSFLLRTSAEPLALVGAVRDAVRDLDPAQPITEITTLDQVVHGSVARPRFLTGLLVGFATVAVALAGVGIYGVVSFQIGRRIPELGLRQALGASGSQLVALVLRVGLLPVLTGAVLGVAAALGLTRLMRGLLFEVSTFDPATYVAVVGGVLAVALLACVPAARTALRSDAAGALRAE